VKKITLFIFLGIFLCQTGFGAEIATTESGKKVKLNDDGTWTYLSVSSSSNELKRYVFSANQSATFQTPVKTIKIKYDPNKWKIKNNTDDPNKVEISFFKGDLYAMVIAERFEMDIDGLKELALRNALSAANDARIVFEEERFVNGKKLVCMKIEGTIQKIKFAYFGYYYASEQGVIQLLTYTSRNLLQEYQEEVNEFLNGLVID
jgi:hypothetical protein